jgi:hypothetical protein
VADAIGPRQVCRATCSGCPALKATDWVEYPDGERDSGTTGHCSAADKFISHYWNAHTPVPKWCPASGVAIPEGGRDGK